jgi:hypothetical protein
VSGTCDSTGRPPKTGCPSRPQRAGEYVDMFARWVEQDGEPERRRHVVVGSELECARLRFAVAETRTSYVRSSSAKTHVQEGLSQK